MTLIEIMIVVVIMGMLATAAGIAVMSSKKEADLRMARTDINNLAQVAEAYQLLRGAGECPTLTQMEEAKLLRRGTNGEDPWGSSYEVVCDDDEVNVRSLGPDRERGTPDDIALF
jgi:general secretion pathway protein G